MGQHFSYRDPVHSRRTAPAVAANAGEGDTEVAGVRNEPPELPEYVFRNLLASRVQGPLHAQEPRTVVLGCHIHGFPLRLWACTHLLPPFAVCAAFPRSDYYGGSAPPPRRRRAWRLAGLAIPGARLEVPAFAGGTLGAVGGQLNPWQLWLWSLRDQTTSATDMSVAPGRTKQAARLALRMPHDAASHPYRGFRH